MLLRLTLLAVGVLELLAPRRFVDFWMDQAVADDEPVELRPWVYTAARLEGLVIVAWILARCTGGFRSSGSDERHRADSVDVIE
jgi:hypothetical protein